nr:GIY-YIG nuclease family protein [Fodinibius salsisoli]
MSGFIYIAINNSMPNLIKIGFSKKNPLHRLDELYSTGVPEPFMPIASFNVKNPEVCEKEIHALLKEYRINNQREFFRLEPSKALKLSIDIILEFIPDGIDGAVIEGYTKAPSFDEDQTFALRLLIEKPFKSRGLSIEAMRKNGHWANALELEYKLLELEREGLIKKFKQKRRQPSIWKITSIGIKFMLDNDLVHDSVREQYD